MTRQRPRKTMASELNASSDEGAVPIMADTQPVDPKGLTSTASPRPSTKLALLQQRLSAPGGATLPALLEATGWQAHTLRAALTRLRQAGHGVERGRTSEGVTTYRIVVAAADETYANAGAPHPSIASDCSPLQSECAPNADTPAVTTAPVSDDGAST